ncbi:NAD-dependent DNA ligase LigA [candidate division WOR-3 bacterium]|nr:NAD-dependent DNA ligase LigA [candidate division WOR-3 bacterium]
MRLRHGNNQKVHARFYRHQFSRGRKSYNRESSEILKDVLAEIESLRDTIRKRDYEYYVLDSPTITDEAYDRLFSKLKKLEEENPEFKTPDSPTQRVGEKPSGKFNQVKHKIPMLSLDNTYTFEEIEDFDKRIKEALSSRSIQYVVEPKIDGVAVSVIYKNGVYKAGITRGDGNEGDDITANIKTIKSLPLKLISSADFPQILEIRGEVYMRTEILLKLNREREESGQELFANTRNAAAGSLKNLDPSVVSSRELDILFHTVVGDSWEKHSEAVARLHDFGLPVFFPSKVLNGVDEIIEECKSWEKKRDDLRFGVDGLVVKVDDINLRRILGQTMRSPRWAIAYKFPTERAKTKINKIVVQVGRTGFLTPVALMVPVRLKGTVISRASLYNADEIERLGVRVGDEVLIEKGGEIIPKVVEVLSHEDRSKPFKMPKNCPVCGSEVVHYEGETAYRCISPACPAQLKAKILHFVSRGAMDIEGIGEKFAEKLVEKSLVLDPADLYFLKKDDISNIERMGEKSTDNIIQSIIKSKSAPFHKVITAIGIPNVGVKTAKNLALHFSSIRDLSNVSTEKLVEIPDIGPIVSKAIVDFFKLNTTKKMIDKLELANVKLKSEGQISSGGILGDKTFVITGTLSNPREYIKEIIENSGGKVTSSLSLKTDYLLCGEYPGSKLKKAKELGVKIIGEKEFLELLKSQPS